MRQIINSTYISLDGIIERPETWPTTGGFGEQGNRIQSDLVAGSSAVIMGRQTYESFAEVWPAMSGNPLADRMNALPKYVASNSLENLTWNNSHIISGDIVTPIKTLKEEPGGDIVQFGFGPVTRALLAAGLLDRLRLWVHPFILGGGAGGPGLLHGDTSLTRFHLAGTATLESGIVVLEYRTDSGEERK
ncbi:MAG TPA: dihydrofolate reductase family protein [Mycobacteriales bacterium]|nr:dihydrofolate reductase family protein [Mycobacteriales bacterium]